MKLLNGFALCIAGLFLLTACEQRSQAEILAQVDGMTSAAEVRAVLGPADKVTGMGTAELWRYDAVAQDVCFAVAGDTIVRFSCI